MDVGWIVAGVLTLVCLWLLTVIEHAYQTGINQGRIEELDKQIEAIRAERMGRAGG